MVDMIFNGATTVAVTNYSSGTFDGRGSPSPNHGLVNLTLSPSTNGTSTPAQNVSTVYGSYGGMNLTLADPAPGNTPATDGSQTKLVYWDGREDDSGANTGHTHIKVLSKAEVELNLIGGWNMPLSSVVAEHTAHPTQTVGQCVQNVGGTWITPMAGIPAPLSIDAHIQGLTFINAGDPPVWGNLHIEIDTNGTYAIENWNIEGAAGAMVKPATGDGTGFMIFSITAAALAARATWDGSSLTIS